MKSDVKYILLILLSLLFLGLVNCEGINPQAPGTEQASSEKESPSGPTPFPVKFIYAGTDSAYAIKADGSLWGWGSISGSELPVPIGTEKDWKIVKSVNNITAAIKENGSLWLWGDNQYGQIGNNKGGSGEKESLPTELLPGTSWIDITLGREHVLALRSDHTLWSWGSNSSGQLGDGTRENSYFPKQVKINSVYSDLGSNDNWQFIAAGRYTSYAVDKQGLLWGWGSNGLSSLLGAGSDFGSVFTQPTPVNGHRDWSYVLPGSDHVIGIKTDGTLWAWGTNGSAARGDNNSEIYLIPHLIDNSQNWQFIQSSPLGGYYSIGIKTDGTLWGWGYNYRGQLLDSPQYQYQAAPISESTDWLTLSTGSNFTIALKTDGTLWSWGDDQYGQLGDGHDDYPTCDGECTSPAMKRYAVQVQLP